MGMEVDGIGPMV